MTGERRSSRMRLDRSERGDWGGARSAREAVRTEWTPSKIAGTALPSTKGLL